MLRLILIASALTATTAAAQDIDFSIGSEAKSWNLYAEYPATFEATVVDILCELTGDCPDNCGDGNRQLGLLRTIDDVLVFPNKNAQAAFTGATQELLPYCGQSVDVDGLELFDDDLGAFNVYLVQTIKPVGADEWVKADNWTKVWADLNPDAEGKGPWYRRDPRVLAQIAEHGHFGLGTETDQQIKDELWP